MLHALLFSSKLVMVFDLHRTDHTFRKTEAYLYYSKCLYDSRKFNLHGCVLYGGLKSICLGLVTSIYMYNHSLALKGLTLQINTYEHVAPVILEYMYMIIV